MQFLLKNLIKLSLGVTTLGLLFLSTAYFAEAQFNQQINYQGKLTDSLGVAVADGDYNMNFWLLASSTAATSTAVWSEARTGANKVTVTNGLFSVMLGNVSSLNGVDFDQTLYLGVEIGGTGTPAWDGEMSPRKVLGAVPAAFVAETANTFDGLATTSFLRADDADTMEATSSSALLTLIQNGAGNLLSIFSGATEMFTVLNNGNVGIATTTPDSKLTVVGNSYLEGNLTVTGNATISGTLADSNSATGTLGQILSSTGTGTDWVSTSTLGLGDGTFLGLSDTISSYTANRILFTNSAGNAVTDSASFTFDDINLILGTTTGIAWDGTRYLYASSTSDSISFGEDAGSTFTDLSKFNVALGYHAGRYASSTTSDYGNMIGYRAGYNNTAADNNIIGSSAGYNNTGSVNNIIGKSAGYANTGNFNNFMGESAGSGNTGTDNNFFGYFSGSLNKGSYNNLIGTSAGYNNTGSYNDFFGYRSGLKNTGNYNALIGYDTGYNLQSTSSIVIGVEAYRGGSGSTAFQAVNNVALGYRAGYNAQTGSSNNILLGYQAADNLTSGANNIVIGYDVDIASTTGSNQLNIGNLIFGTGIDGTGTALSSGNIGIGTSTPEARLSIEKLNYSAAGVAGLDQYFSFSNNTASAIQYANRSYIYATNTATTTIVGNIIKLNDSTSYGNTVRGFEVQTDNGTNTLGENTALSGFARTFGVRGVTSGDAGGTYEPAGVFAETEGTTQGNAIRGYSSTITSATLLKLFQDTSTFTGTGLLMNFGNSGGSFSSTTASKFIDLQNAGTSMFTVNPYGMLTIGNGTTTQNAGIQVGYGGICVDNDGSCNASTTGRISAVSYHTGNSDLAEMYFSNESLEPGDVIYTKGGLSIGKADDNSKSKIIGVVSTKPGMLLGFDDISLNKNEEGFPVALSGRVPVKLSNENGPIKAGDELMLSSIPGVAMKATSTGLVVGVALEDFDESKAYSKTYINQFGDDLIDSVFVPQNQNVDPKQNDSCYNGGGVAAGEEGCVSNIDESDELEEVKPIVLYEEELEALARLAKKPSKETITREGKTVYVGQAVMFVDIRHRYIDDRQIEVIDNLLLSAEIESDIGNETIWERLVKLANNFVDGILSVFKLKADKIEIKDELCVDGVCVNGEDLRILLEQSRSQNSDEGEVGKSSENNQTIHQNTENDNGIKEEENNSTENINEEVLKDDNLNAETDNSSSTDYIDSSATGTDNIINNSESEVEIDKSTSTTETNNDEKSTTEMEVINKEEVGVEKKEEENISPDKDKKEEEESTNIQGIKVNESDVELEKKEENSKDGLLEIPNEEITN